LILLKPELRDAREGAEAKATPTEGAARIRARVVMKVRK
jgi:hypothetical protein